MVPLEVNFLLEEGKRYTDIRIATRVDGKRHFGGFRDVLVELGGKTILCKDIEATCVGEYKVLWV
jgi:hypothetical protein